MARKKLIHIHSNVYSNQTPQAPAAGVLAKGEIAINYNDTEPAMFIENNSGQIVKFNAVQRSEITTINTNISNAQGDIQSIKDNNGINLNGTSYKLTGSTVTLYAPTSAGTDNQVLLSDGANKSPKWTAQSALTVGSATTAGKVGHSLTVQASGVTIATFDGSTGVTANITYSNIGAAPEHHSHVASELPLATSAQTGIMKVGNFLSADTNGTVSVVTGTTNSTVAVGNHTHSYAGSASAGGAANSVKEKLTVKAADDTKLFDYDGSVAQTLKLTYSQVGAAPASHTHPGTDITSAVASADTVDGYHVAVVTSMPSTPDANTIYILK